MLSLLVALSLRAAPLVVVMPGTTCVGVDGPRCEALAQRLATALEQGGQLRVMTRSDLVTLIGAERQRQLQGCADGSSCLAELGGGLGADLFLTLNVTVARHSWVLTTRLLRVSTGASVASETAQLDSEDLAFAALDGIAGRLRAPLFPSRPVLPWVGVGLGGALVATGLVLGFGVARPTAASLSSGLVSPADVPGTVESGRRAETAAWALTAAGLAVLAGSSLALLLEPSSPQLALIPTPGGGAYASLSLRW
ncbi:MAG: hypothetical protein K1X89_05140 [Myxococcaceae bacterium]|nr:hypothetical protein [Myxococcaceae bacterium]